MNWIMYLVISVIAIVFVLFERKKVRAEKIVLIAVLSALASASRMLFAGIPNVQPASFVIIVAGIAFGGEVGFIVGACTALASNLVLGHGPWTIFQMFAWGMMGLVSSFLAKPLSVNKITLMAYGFLWGFLFGWIMNIWMIISGFIADVSFWSIVTVYASSFPFDLAHAVANAVLLWALGGKFIKILSRITIKYGI